MGKIVLYLVGILFVVEGALCMFAPDVIKNKLIKKMRKIPIKKLSLLPILIGILLVLSASQHRNTLFILLLGVLSLAKGAFGIVSEEKATKTMDWWINKADKNVYRLLGIVATILGSIVLIGI